MSKAFLKKEPFTVKGSCICGQVTYSSHLSGPILPIIYCHCKDCQESHAAAFANVFIAKETATEWQGYNTMSSYNRRGTNNRLFCSTCHTPMASHLNKGTPKASFGLFQSSIRECSVPQKGVMHIFTAEATVPIPEDGLKRR